MVGSTWIHPRFERPPVIETAFSIEYRRLDQWQIPYFGLYWETIRGRYPKLNVQAALPSQIEEFGESQSIGKGMTVDLVDHPPIRCWFYNEIETELIQVQNNRFIFNWKRGLSNEPYPHYENMRPVVDNEWLNFQKFVNEQGLGALYVQQCEVTYINHIEKGVGWKDYGELNEVFPFWVNPANFTLLLKPEVVDINLSYAMPEKFGRLYVRVQSAIRKIDFKEVIQLTLTARGRPRSPEPTGTFEWFDIAQEFIARSFMEITSEKMHALWGMGDVA